MGEAARPRLLIVTGGHPFDRAAFFAVFEGPGGFSWTEAKQPAARTLLGPEAAREFSAIVFYDIAGLRFRREAPPEVEEPPAELVAGFEALLAAGKPLLFLHHGVSSWPGWDRWADVVGTRFFYRPGSHRGRNVSDSGYAPSGPMRAVTIGDHPVTRGLGGGFAIVDERYLVPLLAPDIVPLLRAWPAPDPAEFRSAAAALAGRPLDRDSWTPSPGTDLLAWASRAGASPILTILLGDGPPAHGNSGFRRLLADGISWLIGPEAAAWARQARP